MCGYGVFLFWIVYMLHVHLPTAWMVHILHFVRDAQRYLWIRISKKMIPQVQKAKAVSLFFWSGYEGQVQFFKAIPDDTPRICFLLVALKGRSWVLVREEAIVVTQVDQVALFANMRWIPKTQSIMLRNTKGRHPPNQWHLFCKNRCCFKIAVLSGPPQANHGPHRSGQFVGRAQR